MSQELKEIKMSLEDLGKVTEPFDYSSVIFIKQSGFVLLPNTEFEKLSNEYEKSNLKKTAFIELLKQLPAGSKKVYTLAQLKYDLNQNDDLANTEKFSSRYEKI